MACKVAESEKATAGAHAELDSVIDCVQKNCLGTGVDCHDDLNDNEKQIPVQGDRHGFFFSFLCFSSYVHRIPPFLTVRKSR